MIIRDWTPEKARAFGDRTLTFDHDLHTRPLFSDEGLAEALEAYPRNRLGVFTMGEDPADWASWRKGRADDLSGADLLAAAKAGRIWLNLREANRYLAPYADLAEEVFAEKERQVPGLKTFKRDVGLLISSAKAHVSYHLDVPLVSLWQVRGVKRVWVYPPAAPFVGEEDLEKIVLRESAEQFPYQPDWDAGAEMVELTPGRMVTWAQNAPHRIENGPMLNVSLSMEFMTPQALMRANVIYANGVLRRRAGLRPRLQTGFGPANLGKLAIARGAKALKLQKPNERVLPATFRLDAGQPGVTLPC
ncbi:MAG: hypothetical protein LPJ86_05665 [Caulobacteraceae bacterium]|nr:hypothetical protein [Caulobacteraceae bacterium]